ncbi:MAG: MATE family efflux transporter [Gemmataceae bacterium]|nr:MATE family efflux transporter [Gemmataceae bacterium]
MPTTVEPLITRLPHGPVVGRVFRLAIPVLIQQLLILVVGLSDRWLAGHLPAGSAEELAAYQAAQGTALYLGWFISSYTVLVSAGASAVVARCIGAGDTSAAGRAMHQAILLGLLVGLFGAVIGVGFTGLLVRSLSLEGDAARFCIAYLRPMFWLLPFQVVEAAGIACLQGAGDTRTGLFVQGGIAIGNLPVAWLMCRGFGDWPGLGFRGIAWGTALCYVFGAMAVVIVLSRGRAGLELRLPDFRPDFHMLWRLLRVSLPAGADSLSVVAGQFVFLTIINDLGVVAAAAHTTALGWEALGFQSAHAFGIAAMALVGQNLGAKRPDDAAHAGWTAFGFGCLCTCVMGLIFFIFAPEMARFFNPDPMQARTVAEAVPVLRLVALATPALASTIIFTQALRGAGDTRVPVLFTWCGFLLVRLPLAYLLTGPRFGMGLYGAWLAMCADLAVRGTFFFWRFASGRWKLAQV